ncbi:MAG: TIGR02710 family CRISPR-associated CARF protein [Acidobacteriota bacterium]
MAKYLIMTLGTGEGVEHGLAKSIKSLNPDCIIFLASSRSQSLLERLKPFVPEISSRFQPLHFVRNEDDVEKCAEEAKKIILELVNQGIPIENIDADFTSGTKAMTAGLSIAASSLGVERLVYVTGERDPITGRVITGTERVLIIYPTKLSIDNKRRQLKLFFNKRLFEAGLALCDEILKSSNLPDIQKEFLFWESLFETYWYWDRFDHIKANEIIKTLSKEQIQEIQIDISKNKELLNRISMKLKDFNEKVKSKGKDLTEEEKTELLILKFSPELLSDLIINAERRAEEGKYDDAVARLYRVVEMIAQIALAKKGKDTSNLKPEEIPQELHPSFPEFSFSKKAIAVGIERGFQLLKALGDERADQYLKNEYLKNLLHSRNNSILAHGIASVGKETYENLKEETLKLANSFIPELEKFHLLEKALFPEIKAII